jgi:FixJ family two-component response regulator
MPASRTVEQPWEEPLVKTLPDATVFVVDDDASTCQSLRWLIESVGLRVETFPSAETFLASLDRSRPGCLVLDVRMPGMSGLDLQEKLGGNGDRLPIIVISGYGDVTMAVRAMKNGAVDFIEKPFNDQVLLDRIHKAIEHDVQRRREKASHESVVARFAALTSREREVMQLVVDGKSNRAVAEQLGLSPKTVEVHRARVMSKVGAKSLAELVRLAHEAESPHGGNGYSSNGNGSGEAAS